MHFMSFFELIYTLSVDKITIGIRELRQRDNAKNNKKSGDRYHG